LVRYLSPSESEWTGRNLVAQKKKVGAEILQISGWLQNLAVCENERRLISVTVSHPDRPIMPNSCFLAELGSSSLVPSNRYKNSSDMHACYTLLLLIKLPILSTAMYGSSSIWGLVIGLYLVSVAFRCHEKPARRGSDSSATETANDSSANHRCFVWPSYLGLLRPVCIAIDHQTGRP